MKIFLILSLTFLVSCANGAQHITQNDSFSCGPIALYNALVDKNKQESLDVLRKKVKTKPTGTTIPDFLDTAEEYGIKLKRINPKDFNYSKTYFIAMTVHRNEDLKNEGGHFVYVSNEMAYNLFNGTVETKLNYIVVQGMLYQQSDRYFPIVWEIE